MFEELILMEQTNGEQFDYTRRKYENVYTPIIFEIIAR